MKQIVQFHRYWLVLNVDCARGKLRSNFKIYCANSRHLIKDWYKLQNKEKLPIANQNRKQLDTSSEASIGEMFQNDGDLLVASNDDSKSREDYILDMV